MFITAPYKFPVKIIGHTLKGMPKQYDILGRKVADIEPNEVQLKRLLSSQFME